MQPRAPRSMRAVYPRSVPIPKFKVSEKVVKGKTVVEPMTNIQSFTERPIELAVDTEFASAETLTVQFAARNPAGELLLKLYRAPNIPAPSQFRFSSYTDGIPGDMLGHWRRRRASLLVASRSPVQVLIDLFKLEGVGAVSRIEGYERIRDEDLQPASRPVEPKHSTVADTGNRDRLGGPLFAGRSGPRLWARVLR